MPPATFAYDVRRRYASRACICAHHMQLAGWGVIFGLYHMYLQSLQLQRVLFALIFPRELLLRVNIAKCQMCVKFGPLLNASQSYTHTPVVGPKQP
jgi:hypothetical protein